MYAVRKASGLQVAAWPMAKIPALELQREGAGVGPHGNKDTEMVQGGKSTPAPSQPPGLPGPSAAHCEKPRDQPPLVSTGSDLNTPMSLLGTSLLQTDFY